MCRYIFSLLTLCFAWSLQAQETKVKNRTDTLPNKYLPTGLRIGTDVFSLIRSKDNSFKGWELNFDTDFYRYFLTVDYGYWATNQLLQNGVNNSHPLVVNFSPMASQFLQSSRYTNAGYYIRIGADINFLLKDPDKNMFFLGLRYGISTFSERVNYANTAYYSGFGITTYSLSNTNLSGHWLEITTGLRVRIVSGFWMGFTGRLKFAPTVSGYNQLIPYDMPGYGIIEDPPYWGFNYQLFWRLPFRIK